MWQGTVQERVDSIAASPRAYLVRRPAKNDISPPQNPPHPQTPPKETTVQNSATRALLEAPTP